jgi:hypothetical protein
MPHRLTLNVLVAASAFAVVLALAAASLAAAAPYRIECNRTTGDNEEVVPRRVPSRCLTLDGSFADSVNLANVRWRGWGGSTAKASGVELGFYLPYAHIPVRIKVWRPRRDECGSNLMLYTRVRATSRYGSGTVSPETCSESGGGGNNGTPPGRQRVVASRSCGAMTVSDPFASFRVRVKVTRGNVSCGRAKGLIRGVFRRPNSRIDGWRCVGPQTGYAACTKSGNKVVGTF